MNHEKEIRTITNPIIIEQAPVEDEISLIDLWRTIHNHRRLVITVFMVIMFLIIGYLAMAKRYYRAEAILLPPKLADIQELNKLGDILELNTHANKFTPETIYNSYLINLKSYSLRKNYFDDRNLLEKLGSKKQNEYTEDEKNEIFSGEFNDRIKINRNKRKDPDRVQVSLESPTANWSKEWLDDLISLANRQTVSDYTRAIRGEIYKQIREIESQIKIKKNAAKKNIQDQLTRLQEQLRIATELRIIENPLLDRKIDSAGLIGNQTLSGYLKGVKTLKAEITALESRKDIEPFVNGLRALEEKLHHLKSIHIDEKKIKAVTIDQQALVDPMPNKPKYKVIVALGGFLAFVLALLSAFVAEFVSRTREALREVSD